jgi:hypothetical protein
MKIENFRSEKHNGRVKVLATASWEDSDRPAQEIFFATEEKYAESISCNPNAFLVACILPAMHHGEKRVRVGGKICPELKENLFDVMGWLRHWFEPNYIFPLIEAETISRLENFTSPNKTGFFISGGIDSLAVLRANRLNYPLTHPGSFKYGLLIHGQNIESDNRLSTFKKAFADLSVLAKDAQIELIPVYTNIRNIEPSSEFFHISHGALLAAIAHAFVNCFNTISIAATGDIPTLSLVNKRIIKPHGSHPLIEPYFSSRELRIRYDGLSFSRIDKMRLIADWDVALQNIRVCEPNWPGENCGRCEKCVRTMLALLALGLIDKTKAFQQNDLSAELVKKIHIPKPSTSGGYGKEIYYLELMPLLARNGYEDLANAIHHMLKKHRNRYHNKGLRAKIKGFDSKYLGNNLVRIKNRVHGLIK